MGDGSDTDNEDLYQRFEVEPDDRKTLKMGDGSDTENEDLYQRFEVEPDDSDEPLDAEFITTYIPRGHIKIRTISTETADSGELVPVERVQTINDSILEAAYRSIEAAIQINGEWRPEDILQELLCQEPFCYLDPAKVLERVLGLWKDLTEKLKESPNVGSKSGKINKYMIDWLNKMEGLLMMLDGLTPSSNLQQKRNTERNSTSMGSDERGGGNSSCPVNNRNESERSSEDKDSSQISKRQDTEPHDDAETRRKSAEDDQIKFLRQMRRGAELKREHIRKRAAYKRSYSESSSEDYDSSQIRNLKRLKGLAEERDTNGFLDTDIMTAIQMSLETARQDNQIREIRLHQNQARESSGGAPHSAPGSQGGSRNIEQRMIRVENTLAEILAFLKGTGEKK